MVKTITINAASVSQVAPTLIEATPILYTARYIYNPGTMITIEGTVKEIRGYPLISDASSPATNAAVNAAASCRNIS